MATVTLSVAIKNPTKAAFQLWFSLDVPRSTLVGITVLNDKARVKVAAGKKYVVFWQFYGAPGAAVGFEIKDPAGTLLLGVKESKIPVDDVYQAGARRIST